MQTRQITKWGGGQGERGYGFLSARGIVLDGTSECAVSASVQHEIAPWLSPNQASRLRSHAAAEEAPLPVRLRCRAPVSVSAVDGQAVGGFLDAAGEGGVDS